MAEIVLITNLEDAAKTDVAKIEQNLEANYPGKYRAIKNGNFILVSKDVTKDITAKLGIFDGGVGMFLVSRVSAYFGFGPGEIWEWISLNGDDDG